MAKIPLASNVELLAFRFVQAPLVLHIIQSDDKTQQHIHLQKRRYTRYVLECVNTFQFIGTPLISQQGHSAELLSSCLFLALLCVVSSDCGKTTHNLKSNSKRIISEILLI